MKDEPPHLRFFRSQLVRLHNKLVTFWCPTTSWRLELVQPWPDCGPETTGSVLKPFNLAYPTWRNDTNSHSVKHLLLWFSTEWKTHNSCLAQSLESASPITSTHLGVARARTHTHILLIKGQATNYWKDRDRLCCHLNSLQMSGLNQSFCQAVNPSTQSQYYAVLNHLLKQSVSSAELHLE